MGSSEAGDHERAALYRLMNWQTAYYNTYDITLE